ncbi:MAG: 4Fe-4S dicluster domain-containing protein [Candidatus Lokiarchaeota archaeon]|nr:4Fe-4S dicluster domain-containing protein [Candidatus Lokiarchaeota archaeon]
MKANSPYERIVKKLNKLAIAAPDSKKFIEYLKLYIPKKDAEIVAELDNFTGRTKSARSIAKSINKSVDETKKILKRLVDEGKVLYINGRYALHTIIDIFDIPLMVPKEEYKDKKIKKLARLSEDFFKNKWNKEIFASERPFLRVIPVEQSIDVANQKVTNAEEISSRLKRAETIVKTTCPCRARKEILGERKCDYPLESCLMLDFHGNAMAELGKGKVISQEEAMDWINEATRMGLVHMVENCDEGPYFFVCSCCPCCCIGLRGLLELGNPRAVAPSNYIAVVDEDQCTGCEFCLEKCHFNAISMVDNKARIDPDKCMGCSICSVSCPFIEMKRIDRERTPKNLLSLYGEIAKEKGRSIF